jgi:hypothetical protein
MPLKPWKQYSCRDAELQRVDTETLGLAESLDERIADVVRGRRAAQAADGPEAVALVAEREVGPADLLELAEFIAPAHHVGEAVGAFGVALDLHDLHQRLQGCAQRCDGAGFLEAGGVVLDVEQAAVGVVRVVGNGEHVAAGAGLDALALQALPQLHRFVVLDGGEGQRGHRSVPEDHVPVDLRELRRPAPLVAVEGREAAGFAGVVPACGGLLEFAPDAPQRAEAEGEVGSAELRGTHPPAELTVALGFHEGSLGIGERTHASVPRAVAFAPEGLAARVVVDLRVLIDAERGLADEFRVLAHGGEVECPFETCDAAALELEGGALGEAVGVVRGGLTFEYKGVHGPARVNVEIAEEGLTQRFMGGAAPGLAAIAGFGQAFWAVSRLR